MNLITVCFFLLVSMAGTDLFAKDCFPTQQVSYSPDKRHTILWTAPKGDEMHHLTLADEKVKINFFEFNRHACVCWEPTGEYFALTDYLGSNVSEAYIYSANRAAAKILDILDIIPATASELYARNHHSYIEVLSWNKAGMLVHLWGHGDLSSNGFDKTFRCSQKEQKWSCVESSQPVNKPDRK